MMPQVLLLKPMLRLIVMGAPVAAFGLAGLIGLVVVTSALALYFGLRGFSGLPSVLRKATLTDDPRVTAAVAKIAERANRPAPRAGVVDAIGREHYQAIAAYRPPPGTVVVTRPLVTLLDDDELTAVIGHELAHVWHPVKGRVAILLTWGLLAGALAEVAYAYALFGPHLDREDAIYSLPLVILLLLFDRPLLALFPLAVSRHAEFDADEWACRMGCDGLCLATALWELTAGDDAELAKLAATGGTVAEASKRKASAAARRREARQATGRRKLAEAARKHMQTITAILGDRPAGRRSWTAARRREALTKLLRSDLIAERLTARLLSTHPSVMRRTRRLLRQAPPEQA